MLGEDENNEVAISALYVEPKFDGKLYSCSSTVLIQQFTSEDRFEFI